MRLMMMHSLGVILDHRSRIICVIFGAHYILVLLLEIEIASIIIFNTLPWSSHYWLFLSNYPRLKIAYNHNTKMWSLQGKDSTSSIFGGAFLFPWVPHLIKSKTALLICSTHISMALRLKWGGKSPVHFKSLRLVNLLFSNNFHTREGGLNTLIS